METIYKVTTEGDVEGRTTRTLGYVTGKRDDIFAYFDDKKAYSISIEPIKVIPILPTSVNEKKLLLQRKKELESELKRINDELS